MIGQRWTAALACAAALLLAACEDAARPAEVPEPEAAAVETSAGFESVALPDGLVRGGVERVTEVLDGDTVVLSDGREVRLVGIQAPKLPLGRPDFEPWPLADEAKAALAALVGGENVALHFGETRIDRHGRLLAHLTAADGSWVQEALLRQGLARVYSFADNRRAVGALHAAEAEARAADRGIWRDPFYAVKSAEMLAARPADFSDRFEIVRGRVLDTGEARGRLYLNFGERWKTDFTVEVPPRVRRKFATDPRLQPEQLSGRNVEVRGWVELKNGPMIEISHPEQITVFGFEREPGE